MINSRDISQLLPCVKSRANAFLANARESLEPAGVNVIVTSTYRDDESQNDLYAIGRTKAGKRVTNASGGQSFHNYRVAFDIALLYHGKTVQTSDDFLMWDDTPERVKLWQAVGVLGELAGLEWSGRWKGSLREMAHFQYTGGLTLAQLQAGKLPC